MSYCRKTHTYFDASEGLIATNQYGEKHLYSPFAEFLYCHDCGERLVEEPVMMSHSPIRLVDAFRQYQTDLITEYVRAGRYRAVDWEGGEWLYPQRFRRDSRGHVLCPEHQDNYAICEDCGCFIDNPRIVHIDADDTMEVCEHCLNRNYTRCSDCGHYVPNENIRNTTTGSSVCTDCIEDHYSMCECCNIYIYEDYRCDTDDGAILCSRCYEANTQTCEDCEQVFYYDENIRYYHDQQETLCNSCAEERGLLDNEQVIKNYSYKPEPIYRTIKGEETNEFFGFEIEVAGNKEYAKQFVEYFDKDQIYLKYDGSVSGFEIVTHPMSREYFYKKFVPKLEQGMDFLRKNRFKGHNKGGIHIHVSNVAISAKQLKRMVLLMYSKQQKNFKTWLAITQRRDYELDRWASIRRSSLSTSIKNTCTNIDNQGAVKSIIKKPDLGDQRYMGINTKNKYTTEFRVFNSNTRIERIIKNAEVVFSLLDFAATDIMPTMTNYLDFVMKNKEKYSSFYGFLVERKICKTIEQKEKTKETIEKLGCKSVNDLKRYIKELNIEDICLSVDDYDEERTNVTCA